MCYPSAEMPPARRSGPVHVRWLVIPTFPRKRAALTSSLTDDWNLAVVSANGIPPAGIAASRSSGMSQMGTGA